MPKSTRECIREMSIRGSSQREIARTLGVSRNTVAKYLAEDLSPKAPVTRTPASPTMAPYADEVRGWLEADGRAPRKQRHTAKRVYDRLVDERGFDGSLSTVERFVREWREARDPSPTDGFLELGWPAGAAQGDYGNATAVLGGSEVALHELVVSFPHSNGRFCVCSMSQRSECLCESMMRVFEHVGGVPHTLVLANAPEAGRRLAGVVRESGLFTAFRQHLGFEVRFCNPYAGHEKGSVENAVGFLRRNLMVPVPEAEDLDALNGRLLAGCDRLLGGTHYREGAAVGELLAEDGAAMLPLPSTRFDAVRWERRRADREGRVEVDGTLYCAGPYWHGRWMLVGLRDRTVEIRDERGRHAATLPRSWGARETVFDPATLIPAVTARPRSWEQSQLRACVGQPLREGLDRCGADARRLVLRALRSASGRYGFEAASHAASEVLSAGRLPDEAALDLACRSMRALGRTGAAVDLGVYDALAEGGGRLGQRR